MEWSGFLSPLSNRWFGEKAGAQSEDGRPGGHRMDVGMEKAWECVHKLFKLFDRRQTGADEHPCHPPAVAARVRQRGAGSVQGRGRCVPHARGAAPQGALTCRHALQVSSTSTSWWITSPRSARWTLCRSTRCVALVHASARARAITGSTAGGSPRWAGGCLLCGGGVAAARARCRRGCRIA